jgi:hypothetical protein
MFAIPAAIYHNRRHFAAASICGMENAIPLIAGRTAERPPRKATPMNESFNTPDTDHQHYGAWKWPVAGVLAVTLAGNIFLGVRSHQMSNEIAALRDATGAQFTKLNTASEAARAEYQQRLSALNDTLSTYHNDSSGAVARLRAEAKKQSDQLSRRLEQQQSDLSGQLSQVKSAADSANAKLSEVSTDVGSVKSDVSGVKTDVTSVRNELASAQSALNEHAAELKRMVGDMGTMSGLIATNAKELATLRQLGERNYYEFTLSKNQKAQKVGDIVLALKKADANRNRFTLEVTANDKRVEKKDRTVNEPVQIYFPGDHIPHEIVVNQVKKDAVVGYLSTPKVTLSQR